MSKPKQEKLVFDYPKYLKPNVFHYCPGCGHSIAHRLVAEVMDELEIGDRAIGVPPAGCAVLAYNYLDVDMTEAAHGRACAVATGIKRYRPDCIVFSYQGDGDMAAIGTAETIHAANRGERITVIFINNAVYGMTGGQMAPTTLLNQVTKTTPRGRDAIEAGFPISISEMMALCDGAVYINRVAVTNAKNVRIAKKAIKRAFQVQMADAGFSLVEILSPCPTNMKMKPTACCKWVNEEMTKTFPLGLIKDTSGVEE